MILQEYDDLKFVLEAANGQDLTTHLADGNEVPDVLLLDLEMPVMNGIESTKYLQLNYPEIKIIILTTHYTRSFILNMIELGAASYLTKNSEPEEVITTIREVASKGFHYNDHIMNVIRDNMVNKEKKKSLSKIKLTRREKEILQLICEQYTTTEIAQKLYISPRTVDGHRNKLLEKTNSKNTAGLVVYALENKFIQLNKSWM